MASAIVINIEERCQCGFTQSTITSDGFRCFPGSTDAVTYRGEIHETDTANVFDLMTHIEEWTAEGVSILVQRVFIEVDSSCRVVIESFNENECLPRTITTSESPRIAIIGGAVSAVVLVLILIICIVAITMVILVLKSRKALYKLENDKNRYVIRISACTIIIYLIYMYIMTVPIGGNWHSYMGTRPVPLLCLFLCPFSCLSLCTVITSTSVRSYNTICFTQIWCL